MDRYHTFWKRFWAGILDGLLFIPFDLMDDRVRSLDLSATMSVLWLFVSYFIFSAYVVIMHARYGQTVGKMITGVTVLTVAREDSISSRQSVIRESPYIGILLIGWLVNSYAIAADAGISQFAFIDMTIGYAAMTWFILEVITMLFNDKRRALHDYIAGTVVVRST